MQSFASENMSPTRYDFAGCGSTDGWQTLLTAGWHALAWEDFVWSFLSPASTESTGAEKSHSTSPSNGVSAPLVGKLCAQREDVAGSHRGRITLQRRKNSQLGLIHQVTYIKIPMELFDLVQRSIPVKDKLYCYMNTCAAVFWSVDRY